MFQTQIDTQARLLHIQFPEGAKIRKVSLPITSSQHAANLFDMNVAKYIIAKMTRWVKQREWALKYTHSMTPAREYAIGRLHEMLANHAESKLHMVILQMAKHDSDIAAIAPAKESRYYRHYLYNIVNIRYWCRNEYAKRYHPDLKNRL